MSRVLAGPAGSAITRVASPVAALALDFALVGLDLDEGGFLDAVRRAGWPALCPHGRHRINRET